ncbi:DUF1998 domain-containing protein [Nocardioidaceae bacterium]|nr:DUF1998 domain-containing protein [Nocardioidaceae bacterium]
MATSDKPRARQSQLVTTYGVGSLFPAGDQSFIICGTEDWDDRFAAAVEEPRLAKSLGVHTFRSPPTGRRAGDIPVVRFPTFAYCPDCRRLARFWEFNARKMRCEDCERDLTPSRFVACCEAGHIEDFPYFQWVHTGGHASEGKHALRLVTRGASSSLSDIEIKCSCGLSRSLAGSFSSAALVGVRSCKGKRPWLPGAPDEQCDKRLRVLQRGSSNVWFAAVRSALSIPPWSGPAHRLVSRNWDLLKNAAGPDLEGRLSELAAGSKGVTVAELREVVERRLGLHSSAGGDFSEQKLRTQEYEALSKGNDAGSRDNFQCEPKAVGSRLSGVVAQVSAVNRLREVRALQGFSRVTPKTGETPDSPLAPLSAQPVGWLPATEVLGEGVFVRLDEAFVERWESDPEVVSRHASLEQSMKQRAEEYEAGNAGETPSPRFVAVHSLAHALLQELSLEAGYPVGSLRERIYADTGQAGILIYTASSDAAGSLGGLAALARTEVLERMVVAAVRRAAWCSNDPVCREAGPSGSDGLNLAACHACMLLPETSCEHRNIFLDRAALVGTHEESPAPLMATLEKED